MPSYPTQITGQYYDKIKSKLDFAAWNPWGEAPVHHNDNDGYIPIANRFVKQFDYPAALQKLIDYGWKTGKTPATAPTSRFTLGAQRRVAATNGFNPATTTTTPIPTTTTTTTTAAAPQARLRTAFGANRLVSDWDHMKLFEQVGAYTFRGDSRTAEEIEKTDGFHPPASRTDAQMMTKTAVEFVKYLDLKKGLGLDAAAKAQMEKEVEGYLLNQTAIDRKLFVEYQFWRDVLEASSMHLKGMTDDSFLKAYVSTTREVQKATGAANGSLGGGGVAQQLSMGDVGWIYVLRIESGFMLKTGVGGVTKVEAEVAHLGPVLWKNVMGFRHLCFNGEDSKIYIRRELHDRDFAAFKQVLGSLTSLMRS